MVALSLTFSMWGHIVLKFSLVEYLETYLHERTTPILHYLYYMHLWPLKNSAVAPWGAIGSPLRTPVLASIVPV